jgi:Na+/H+ antiporter NhaD/arsenite permease-like protein
VFAAVVVFALTYVAMSSRRVAALGLDRPAAALVGAAAMVVVGGLPMQAAMAAVNLDIIGLLLGVLLIAAYLQEAQFFRRCAYEVLTRARSARALLWGLALVAGALSALLVNDTVCLVLTPLVVAVAVEARLPALPYLLVLATSSNIGGVVSFSGNPQNMIVGAAANGDPSFATYLLLTLPIGAACLATNTALIGWMFRHQLPPGPLVDRQPPRPAVDRWLAGKALASLGAFAVMAIAGVSLAGAALTSAAGLVLVARAPSRKVWVHVDWSLLLFFAGLMVVVAGLVRTGLVRDAFAAVEPVIARGDVLGDLAFVLLIVVVANVVSNVPLVLVAVAWVPHLPDPAWSYTLLAVASTLAGNLTLLGSVANVIVMEGAGPRGEISYGRFLRYGAVLTAASLLVAMGGLWLERALGLI